MPEIPCPACRKRIPENPECPRCGADVRALREILEAAARYLEFGRDRLKRKAGNDALSAAEAAWDLRHTPEAARLAFMACLQLRQWDGAAQWYGRARRNGTGLRP
ncbi:MAG: hypothetical protein ACLFPR_09400 [Desulfococcaceae bacterium]